MRFARTIFTCRSRLRGPSSDASISEYARAADRLLVLLLWSWSTPAMERRVRWVFIVPRMQASVAKMERPTASGAKGGRFEYCRARHLPDHSPESIAWHLVQLVRHAGVTVGALVVPDGGTLAGHDGEHRQTNHRAPCWLLIRSARHA